MNQFVSDHHRRGRLRRRGLRHPLVLILLTGFIAVAGLGAVVWWQERPLRQAAAFLEQGDPGKALSTIDAFLRDRPNNGRAMTLKARILVATRRPIQAIDLFERFGGSSPEELHAWAQAILQLQRWSEAIPLLEHLRSTGFDRADVLHELAACRGELGDLSDAIVAATEFSQLPGCAARGNFLLGSLYNQQGNLRMAATAWGDVLKDSPDADGLQVSAASFFLDYARVLQVSGQSRLAAELVERSLSLERSPGGLILLGDAQSDLGEREQAEKSYRDALAINPGLAAARVGLARISLFSDNAGAAKEWLSPLESPDKLTSEIAVLLQQATTRLGETEESKKWREKADRLQVAEKSRDTAMKLLSVNPGSRLAEVVHACQLAQSGQWSEAGAILKPMAETPGAPPFIQQLYQAVQQRSDLPPLELLPLK